jgi:hypothetical protein
MSKTIPKTTTTPGGVIGGVGYTFRKHFDGFGWFEGKVLNIRPDAGK